MICAHNSGAEAGTLPLPVLSGWAVNRQRLPLSARFKNDPLCHSRPRQKSGEPGAPAVFFVPAGFLFATTVGLTENE